MNNGRLGQPGNDKVTMLNRKDMYAVILAGGSGERFWPMSTSRRPKQFLTIPSGKPLIRAAVERIKGLIPQNHIFIITRRDLVGLTRRAIPGFPAGNIIGEPCGRDTAAAVALGAAIVKKRNPEAAFCVLTADQVIGNRAEFIKTLREAFRLAFSGDCLVTIGIKPDYPSTGFGYIEAGAALGRRSGTSAFKVRRFVEKPDQKTAMKYFSKRSFYWNSGMFIWGVSSIEKAIAAHRPPLMRLIGSVANAAGSGAFQRALKKEYAKLEKISIDYAILEKARNIVMVGGSFDWDDVGSWSALEKHCRKDSHGNIMLGQAAALDAGGNIAVAEDGMIAMVGVRDLVVVRSGAATLVCARDRVQDVKKIVALLKNSGKYKGLV
mgnify:CR=1 FL=1